MTGVCNCRTWKSADDISVSTSAGVAATETHMGRLRGLLITVFEYPNVSGHQSLDRDQVAHCKLARERQ